jgi:hypothetical protein
MIRIQSKPKLLLDENFEPRKHLPKLNAVYDVKHVAEDFRTFADKSMQSGIIGASANLSPAQIDTKLVALLRSTNQRILYGGFHVITGETHT